MLANFADPEFLTRLRANETTAIEAVVQAYLAQILRAARGAGLDAQQAEDVTQSVFLTFMEGIHRFEGRSHVRTWLFGILYRKIAEIRRSVKRENEQDPIDGVMEQRFDASGRWVRPPVEADREVLDAEIRTHLAECLDGVPDRQRMAFHMREVEELATDEICNILEVTGTHLGVLLFRARNRLRECLEKRGLKG